jgi:hypothetical protein
VRQRGFAPLIIILVIAILGVVGYFGYRQSLVRQSVSNHSFLQKIVEFSGKNEHITSFDIDSTGTKIVAITVPDGSSGMSEKAIAAHIYLLDENGNILLEKQIDVHTIFPDVIYGTDDNIYVLGDLRRDTATEELNQQLETINIDIHHYANPDPFSAAKMVYSENNISSASASFLGKWVYKFNNVAFYHFQCINVVGLDEDSCSRWQSTIQAGDKEIIFNNLSMEFTSHSRYLLNNGGIVVIISDNNGYFFSKSWLYILK